jgi:DNA-binding response OmpR family regulator
LDARATPNHTSSLKARRRAPNIPNNVTRCDGARQRLVSISRLAMARLLVIEDDNTIRHLIVCTLENAGHEVIHASTGREGVRLFEKRGADLLITDLVMPDDSLESVIELCHDHPTLPIILVSGLAVNSPRTVDVAAALRVRRTLPKPFKLAELLAVTRSVLAEENIRPLASGDRQQAR